MEHQKILNLLNEASDYKFVKIKWNIVNNQSNTNYDAGNEIIYSTEVLRSNLCDYNNGYILVRGDIITKAHNNPLQVAFTNFAPFIKCITKIDGTIIDDVEDLDLVMLMYNLIEHISNYSDTTGSLWFYSKDEATKFNVITANSNAFKSFEYKAKLLGNTVADGDNSILKNATIAVPSKYLNGFWRSLEMPLINYRVELKFRWTKHCVLASAGVENDKADSNNIIFNIKDTILYVPVFTFLVKDNQKLSKCFSKGFQRSVYWNEYKTKSENKNMTNEKRYFLKSTFAGVNRLFILVYSNSYNDVKRFKAQRYYLPKSIIKHYNVIIIGKTFMTNPFILT